MHYWGYTYATKYPRWTSEVTISADVFIFIANYSPAREGSPPLSSLLCLQPPSHNADKAKCLDGWVPSAFHSFIQSTTYFTHQWGPSKTTADRQSKGGGSGHDRYLDTLINTVYAKLWGLGRDRGGGLKLTQVIKTLLEKENQHETWRPTAPSESRAGPRGS